MKISLSDISQSATLIFSERFHFRILEDKTSNIKDSTIIKKKSEKIGINAVYVTECSSKGLILPGIYSLLGYMKMHVSFN